MDWTEHRPGKADEGQYRGEPGFWGSDPTSGGVASRDRGSDHDKDCRHRNGNEPTHPVDSRAAITSEGRVDEPTDQNAANPAKHREPNGSVVSATRRNELAQQADDNSGNDYSDDFHDVSLLQPATLRPTIYSALDTTPVPPR